MNSDTEISSIVTRLMAGAPPPGSLENLVESFAERLIAAGFPMDSIALYKYNIHPIFPAGTVLWTKKRGVRQEGYSARLYRQSGVSEFTTGYYYPRTANAALPVQRKLR